MPMYYVVLGISQTRAVSLSKGTIFGVAVGNFFFISRESHPKADRPLIDYSTAIFMQGGELMGVVIGVLINLLLPEIVTICLSAVVLGFNSFKTLQKALSKRRAETVAFAKAAPAEPVIEPPVVKPAYPVGQPPLPYPVEEPATAKPAAAWPPPKEASPAVAVVTVGADKALADKILADRARRFPTWAWALLLVMMTFFTLYSLTIAAILDPAFDNCHAAYWPVFVLPFVFYGAAIAYMARRNIKMNCDMKAAGVPLIEGDIEWTPRAVAMLTPAAIGAGIAAGLLGIGGGMILGPIFVALNFQPQVGTATTGFMILFTALGGTIKYLTIGKLPWQFFLWFGSIGVLGGQTGQRVVKRLIVRTGRPSYVVFILGGIIGLAVIVMTSAGIVGVLEDARCGVEIWKPNLDDFMCHEER